MLIQGGIKMNGLKDFLFRIAARVSDYITLITLRRSLQREMERTRAESQDRAFLATKQGRLNAPPYASLRQ